MADEPGADHADLLASRYEELRRCTLGGEPEGHRLGLTLLAGWHSATPPDRRLPLQSGIDGALFGA